MSTPSVEPTSNRKSVKSVLSEASSTIKSHITKPLLVIIILCVVILVIFLIVRAIRRRVKSLTKYSSKFYKSRKDATVMTVIKSKDINDGKLTMPYTISIWLNIDKLNFVDKQNDKIILSRGTDLALGIDKNINNLVLLLNTKDSTLNMKKSDKSKPKLEKITIANVPVNTWFQFAFVVKDQEVEMYLNGRLIRTVLLKNMIVNNAEDMLISPWNGFIGSIKDLYFYATALEPQTVYFNYELSKGIRPTSNWMKTLTKKEYNLEKDITSFFDVNSNKLLSNLRPKEDLAKKCKLLLNPTATGTPTPSTAQDDGKPTTTSTPTPTSAHKSIFNNLKALL